MNCYPEEINQPIILPSPSEEIWEKFEYFDKKTEDESSNYRYVEIKDKLLDLWVEQFQKECKAQKLESKK